MAKADLLIVDVCRDTAFPVVILWGVIFFAGCPKIVAITVMTCAFRAEICGKAG